MIHKINKIYQSVMSELAFPGNFNTKETRQKYTVLITTKLNDVTKQEFQIKCDEENNSIELIDDCLLCVRISWKYDASPAYKYVDLIFGNIEQIKKLGHKYC